MRLPELLVAGGVIDAGTVEQVLEAQSLYGGSFDTNLLEEGVVPERTLQPYLEQAFQIRNQIDVFGDPAKDAVARLPRRQAETTRVCPMRLAGRTLDVVVTDPTDGRALDEIGFVTGCRVAVSVACESRVAYLLNRAYNIPIAHRHLALIQGKAWPKPEVAERARRARQNSVGEIELPVVSPLVPQTPASLPEPMPRQPSFAPMVWTPITVAEPPPPMVRAIPRATVQLMPEVLPATAPPLKPAVVLPPRLSGPMAALAPPPQVAAGTEPPREAVPPGYEVIAAQLDCVEEKDQIPPIALGYLATRLSRVVLLGVRKIDIHGWDARGPRLRRETVEHLSLSIDHPSLFAAVAADGEPYEGPLSRGPVEESFMIRLGTSTWPEHVTLAPIRVRGRTAALLYGEATTRSALADARDSVGVLAKMIGEALVRLIMTKKAGA